MSEPNAEEVVEAARQRAPRVQKVTLSSKGEVTVPDDDERVANLVRMGMTLVEARAAVASVERMW